MKQVQSNAKVDTAAGESDLNFVKRPSVLNRLTNSALKQIINQANELSKKNDPKSASNRLKKTLKKTVKAKIKKDAWQKSNLNFKRKRKNFKFSNCIIIRYRFNKKPNKRKTSKTKERENRNSRRCTTND